MKYSDQFFKFPIKVYETTSVRRALKEEEATDIPHDGDWVIGYVRMPYWALDEMCWYDVFTKGKEVAEVADKGFDATFVMHLKYGEFECTWSREKFEKELDKFTEWYDKEWEKENPTVEYEEE